MKCLICHSDDIELIDTIVEESKGYEEYACKNCRGHSEYGIKITKVYTGENDVFPFEIE